MGYGCGALQSWKPLLKGEAQGTSHAAAQARRQPCTPTRRTCMRQPRRRMSSTSRRRLLVSTSSTSAAAAAGHRALVEWQQLPRTAGPCCESRRRQVLCKCCHTPCRCHPGRTLCSNSPTRSLLTSMVKPSAVLIHPLKHDCAQPHLLAHLPPLPPSHCRLLIPACCRWLPPQAPPQRSLQSLGGCRPMRHGCWHPSWL